MNDSDSQNVGDWCQAGRDSLLGFALMFALLIVYGLDALGIRSAPIDPHEPELVLKPVHGSTPAAARLRIGVTPNHYENMGRLLDSLGEGYRYQQVPLEDLLDAEKLREFDILFFTCGWAPREWLGEFISKGERPNTEVREMKEDIFAKLAENLRQFVSNGGTLYASDFRFPYMGNAFPETVAQETSDVRGAVQTVQAVVTNDDLRRVVGTSIELEFDQPGWFPAAFDVEGVLLKGRIETMDGNFAEAPLLVKFPFSKGHVIFTAFHNDHQSSEVVKQLLRFLVFATVTADAESAIADTMIEGGFSPRGSSILSTSRQQAVKQTFQCTQPGPLQFALAFRSEQGAKLHLTVVGPDGRARESDGTDSFIIEVPDAQVGAWKCTVTALNVPYDNFPFTLTVGEKHPEPQE